MRRSLARKSISRRHVPLAFFAGQKASRAEPEEIPQEIWGTAIFARLEFRVSDAVIGSVVHAISLPLVSAAVDDAACIANLQLEVLNNQDGEHL